VIHDPVSQRHVTANIITFHVTDDESVVDPVRPGS
jgi:hypothetical protein